MKHEIFLIIVPPQLLNFKTYLVGLVLAVSNTTLDEILPLPDVLRQSVACDRWGCAKSPLLKHGMHFAGQPQLHLPTYYFVRLIGPTA